MESELLKLKEELGEEAAWKTKMCGLIPSWNNYHDEVNSVSRPAQMGPVWMHAASVANKKISHYLWMTDPPASSYPSCIAVKCAQLQSDEIGESLLYLLRSAAMNDGKNIAKPDVILNIAENLAGVDPSFKIVQFIADFNGDAGANAFKEDLEEVRYRGINRFPSIVISAVNGKTIMLQGFRLFEDMLKELHSVYPVKAVD